LIIIPGRGAEPIASIVPKSSTELTLKQNKRKRKDNLNILLYIPIETIVISYR
jgi:hypothetical protein